MNCPHCGKSDTGIITKVIKDLKLQKKVPAGFTESGSLQFPLFDLSQMPILPSQFNIPVLTVNFDFCSECKQAYYLSHNVQFATGNAKVK